MRDEVKPLVNPVFILIYVYQTQEYFQSIIVRAGDLTSHCQTTLATVNVLL